LFDSLYSIFRKQPTIRRLTKTPHPLIKKQKETTMQYKTITLHLLEQYPQIYDPLRKQRRLLTTLESYAMQLRARHLSLKEALMRLHPESDESQIASEALEIALKEMEDRLSSGSVPQESGPLSLDQAMAFIRRHHSQPA